MIPILYRKNQYGFSLLEVLFAVIILAVALLATARLHAMVTRDGSFAKARGIAANLAQEKIDDLKAFTALYDPDPTAAPDVCGTGKFCYTEIGANTGGKEHSTSGVLEIKCAGVGCTANTSPFAIGNASYTRLWSVTNYYNCTAGSAASTSNCASPNAKAYPDFKLVTVTVTWVDEQGVTQDVSMQTVIYASDPGSLSHMAASMGGVGPKVSYTPIGVPNGVPVPINTGGGKFKESSKPLPVISGSGDGIAVSFDAVTYSGSSGAYTKDSQDEFSTVGCECQFNSTNSGYTPTRKVWKGSALAVQEGTQVTKVAGEPLGNNPPSNCDICCRDHHDRSSNDAKYDPQRPSTDYETSGDHKHYWYSSCVSSGAGAVNCSTPDKNTSLASTTPLTAVTSGAYLESCRVMRHNGIWRVMQDWQLRKITILPYSYLTTGTNLSSYVAMVSTVVEKAVKTDSGNSAVTIPTITPLSGRNLTMTPGDAPIQLLSRAVYVDTIYNAQDDASTTSINEQNTVDAAYYTALLAKITASQGATPPNSDWMENVAFYEVNPTKLFDWTSDTTTIATVSSEEISAIVDPANNYYGNSSRGNVIIQSGTTSGTSTITVTGRLSNSGVTGGVNKSTASYVAGVSYGTDDHDNTNALTDTITVTRSGTSSTTSHSVTGIVKAGNTGPVNLSEASSPITVTATSTTGSVTSACTAQTSDVDPNAWRYSCAVSTGWTGTLTFSSTGNVYTFESATSTTYSISQNSGVTATWNVPDVRAYGNTVTIIGKVEKDNNPSGSPAPDVTDLTTTIDYSGTASGTCSDTLVGNGANAYVEYTCNVPKGWTGSITVTVAPGGNGAYTYLSPGSSPCNGATTGSCTMATITALDNINGVSTPTNQTNVTARR